MKNILFVNVFILVISACTHLEIDTPDASKSSDLYLLGKSYDFVQSKISLGDKEDGKYPFYWTKGDALGLFSVTPDASIYNVEANLDDATDGNVTGKFVIHSGELALSKDGDTELMIYYPYDLNKELSDSSVDFCLDENQKIDKDGKYDYSEYMFAWAKSIVKSEDKKINFVLNHPLSYIKINVSTSEFASCKLKKITLYDKDNGNWLSGEARFDFETEQINLPAPKYDVNGNVENLSNHVSATIESGLPLSTEQSVYLTSFPADFSGKTVYVVVTMEDSDKSTITIPVAVTGSELKAGALNIIDIHDLKSSDNACQDWYEIRESRYLAEGWAYGEANCYQIIPETTGGTKTIEFSVKARGDFTKVTKPQSVKVQFTSDNVGSNQWNMVGLDGDNNKQNGGVISDNCTINVTASKGGNAYTSGYALVSILDGLDESAECLWSFMIWYINPEDQPRLDTYPSGYEVMSCNLGSFFGTPEKAGGNWKEKGAYFQWGRPTPFTWSTAGRLADNLVPTNCNTIDNAIAYPRNYYITNGVENTFSDWYIGNHIRDKSDRKDDLWGNPFTVPGEVNSNDGIKSVYDPCPKGYKVISPKVVKEIVENAKLVIINKGEADEALGYKYELNNGYAWFRASDQRYGGTGKRSSGKIGERIVGYWTNSPASNIDAENYEHGAFCMHYSEKTEETNYKSGRANGFSVRCMKDSENR